MPKSNSKIASLRENVRRLARSRVKMAAIGGDQDGPFEQAFSNLAHAYLKDKAPSLLDYEVGFQLLDRNQESTKAVGVFGFKVGPQWLYAPVFFLNGDLKGHELLYVKNQDSFVPLKENWLNYLLNRKPSVLGEEVGRNLSDLGVMPPHLYQLSRSPNKFAAAVERLSPWVREALPAFAHVATNNPVHDKRYAGMTDLPTFLKKEGKAVIRSLVLGFQDNPKLAQSFQKFYGLSVIDEAVKEATARELEANSTSVIKDAKCVNTPAGVRCFKQPARKPRTEATKSVIDELPKGNEVNVEPGDLLKASAGEPLDSGVGYVLERKLRIYTYDNVLQHGTSLGDLDDKERSKLLKDRVLVKDDRDDKEVVRAYEVTSPVRLQNPTETGLYDVLTRSSGFEKCLIIFGPYSNSGRKDFVTIVKLEGNEKGRSWLNIHPSHIWVGNQYKIEDFQDWWKEQPELKELTVSESGLYVLIGNTGEGTLPFRVTKEVSSGERKTYDVYFKSWANKGRADHLPRVERRDTYDSELMGYGDRIVLTGKRGARLRAAGEDLYVPSDYRILELRPDRDDDIKDDDCACCFSCSDSSEPPPIEPGNQFDIDLLLGTKTAAVKIYDTGSEVEINGRRMQKLAALLHLIRDWNMREKTARVLLKRAETKRVARFRIKKGAQEYDLQRSGPTAPGIPETPMGYDPMTGGRVPTQNLGEWNVKVPDMSAAKTDRMIYHPLGPEPTLGVHSGEPAKPDRAAQQAALQSAQTGQKEIFDTTMIGSLLKTVRDDSMVDRYMGDMMKGLDRLGRILFLFYWHNEKFADRYGKNEMTELEDGLRNAFEYLGDICLFLKQRSIEADPNSDENISLSEVAG